MVVSSDSGGVAPSGARQGWPGTWQPESVGESVAKSLGGSPPAVVRIYRNTPDRAYSAFGHEAPMFEEHGYYPDAVTWTSGEWDSSYAGLAAVLCIVGIGILIIAYMLVTKPAGTLVVIYRRREVPARSPEEAPVPA
jgi:hypothetical protein